MVNQQNNTSLLTYIFYFKNDTLLFNYKLTNNNQNEKYNNTLK